MMDLPLRPLPAEQLVEAETLVRRAIATYFHSTSCALLGGSVGRGEAVITKVEDREVTLSDFDLVLISPIRHMKRNLSKVPEAEQWLTHSLGASTTVAVLPTELLMRAPKRLSYLELTEARVVSGTDLRGLISTRRLLDVDRLDGLAIMFNYLLHLLEKFSAVASAPVDAESMGRLIYSIRKSLRGAMRGLLVYAGGDSGCMSAASLREIERARDLVERNSALRSVMMRNPSEIWNIAASQSLPNPTDAGLRSIWFRGKTFLEQIVTVAMEKESTRVHAPLSGLKVAVLQNLQSVGLSMLTSTKLSFGDFAGLASIRSRAQETLLFASKLIRSSSSPGDIIPSQAASNTRLLSPGGLSSRRFTSLQDLIDYLSAIWRVTCPAFGY